MITPIHSCGERAKHWLAVETARAVAAGRMPSSIDGQTASIALVNEPVPATANVADFESIAGLAVDDWRV